MRAKTISDRAIMEHAVEDLLTSIGEDTQRDGLVDTPARFAKALLELTRGYDEYPAKHLEKTFDETSDQLVVVRQIPFTSLCEHHILPFTGTVSVGYLPKNKVVGLSKIPRMVYGYARRLQVQERLTNQIADAITLVLDPLFVGVLVQGHHTCMSMRGAETDGQMVTSAMRGELRDELKQEFLNLA